MPTAYSTVRISLTLASLLIALLATSAPARADGPARVALFQTATDEPELRELAAALDPVLAADLTHIAAVQVTEHPSLDLPAMQLAIDCVGETADCLRAVTDQTHIEGLVAATLRRAGGETVTTLFFFDARGVGFMKGVTRKHSGNNVEQDTLDEIPEMLNELFTVAEKPKEQPAATPAPAVVAPPDSTAVEPEEPKSSKVPVGPIVLGASGVVLVGVGAIFGAMSHSSESDYADARTNPKLSLPQQKKTIDAINAKLSSAKSQALLCNLGFGVGAAAIVGSVIWWVLSPSSKHAQDHASLTPLLGPGQIGLSLQGRFTGSM